MQQLRRGERRNIQDFALNSHLHLAVHSGLVGGDVSLLGLNEQGRLGDERNFIYFNQPSGAGGAVTGQVTASSGAGRFTLDLQRLPADITRFAVVISHDDQPLSRIQGGRLQLSSGPADAARALYTFEGQEFGSSLAATIAEVYRRAGQWRVGMLGEEYRGGLEGLLRQYGADIQAAPVPIPPVPASPAPHRPPTPVPPAPPRPTAPTPAPPVSPMPPTPTLTPGISLSLQKNQTISLAKAAGKVLSQVVFGLGWDPAVASSSIDLDASCVMLTRNGDVYDTVYFGHLASRDGSIRHTGDNLTGDGDGDDEQIKVDLSRIPAQVSTLVLTINSYRGHAFTSVRNAFCRVVDQTTDREVARYNLSDGASTTGMLMAKLQRETDGWHMTALGEPAKGRVVSDESMLRAVRRHAR